MFCHIKVNFINVDDERFGSSKASSHFAKISIYEAKATF